VEGNWISTKFILHKRKSWNMMMKS